MILCGGEAYSAAARAAAGARVIAALGLGAIAHRQPAVELAQRLLEMD